MVYITELWLPILLSAVLVFIASSILHMVLPIHRNDYKKLPNEAAIMEAMRKEGVSPGDYAFPCPANPKDMGSPEMLEKYNQGPVGLVSVMPTGPPAMGKALGQWFAFCIVIGIFVAYICGRTLNAGDEYLAVFRLSGTVAFMAYAACHATDSIWKGQSWSNTLKHSFDGLVYALLTAGVFGWLWP